MEAAEAEVQHLRGAEEVLGRTEEVVVVAVYQTVVEVEAEEAVADPSPSLLSRRMFLLDRGVCRWQSSE